MPYDSGRRDERMGRGPGRIFQCGIVEALERSHAIVRVSEVILPDSQFPSEPGAAFAIQALVAERVASAIRDEFLPIVLSGNCNTAIGSAAGLMAGKGVTPRVLWLDAHADFNTPETTTSGFIDGMAVAMLTGRCWMSMTAGIPGFKPLDDSRISLLGVRDVDGRELNNLEQSRVVRYRKASEVVLDADAPLYLHIDLDSFDTSEGTANGYSVAGGITRADFMALAGRIRESKALGALALTAYDPAFDEGNRIARLAIDIARALSTGDGLAIHARLQVGKTS